MAIKFLSLFGTNLKRSRPAPTPQGEGNPAPAPAPQPPVPEVTAVLSVKEDFHDEIAHTDEGWFRFDSSRSELLAAMTVSFDITETTADYKRFGGLGLGQLVEKPVRIIHTSAVIRLYRTPKQDGGWRCFVVRDKGEVFLDGTPATERRFYSLDTDDVCAMADSFLNKKIPYAYIEVSLFFSNVTNEKITDITIPDETALKSLIPNY